jgi:LacI family transcriptional regulator
MPPSVHVGLVFSYSYTFYRSVARGIRLYAETRPDWHFTSVFPEERPLRTLGTLKPDGLIAAVNTESLAAALASWRRPLVNVSAALSDPPAPRVGVDNLAVGRLAADHFLERGLRYFAYVGPADWRFSAEREAGFRQAVERAGYHVASYHDPAEQSFDPSARHWPLDRRVHRWLRGLPKPVGLFAPDDLWGLQVSEACRQSGLSVPEEVALLGAENDDLHCELARPKLSSVLVPAQQIGWEAAALLDRLLGGAQPPRRPVLLPPSGVVARQSSDVLAIDDPDVVAAARFIRERGHVRLRVTDVLRDVPVGRRSLERRFRQTFGRGIWAEIRRVHVERAKRLLAETDLPIKQLAEQSGFTDFRHMAVVFRQEIGLSPTAYRNRVRTPG